MQVSALHRKPSSYVTHQFPNVIIMWKNDYLCPIKLSKDRILLDNEDLVYEYFRLILRKDTRRLFDLFVEDAEIHQPFFKHEDIEIGADALIMTARRIYDLLAWYPLAYEKSKIEKRCIDCYYDKNNVICIFRVGQKIIIQFIFKLGHDSKDKSHSKSRKIRFLDIQLI
ncbi:MAG TPA: hypothetical protein VEL11_01850 [Candidatus Bathyarchaeia archaeon]|nr:hypothetical protein [Candidatus Bathyarchaeia archaeon]